jgi:hypothetical protein
MTRPTRTRKARLSLEQQAAAVDDEMTLSSDIEPEEKEYKPRRKKVRKSKDAAEAGSSSTAPIKRPRKAGKLAKLQEMPLDVLFEVRLSLLYMRMPSQPLTFTAAIRSLAHCPPSIFSVSHARPRHSGT